MCLGRLRSTDAGFEGIEKILEHVEGATQAKIPSKGEVFFSSAVGSFMDAPECRYKAALWHPADDGTA